MNLIVAIGAFVLSLIINFLPTIIAFVKGSYEKFNILMLNGIPYALSVVLVFISIPVLNPIVALINIVLWVAALLKALKK